MRISKEKMEDVQGVTKSKMEKLTPKGIRVTKLLPGSLIDQNSIKTAVGSGEGGRRIGPGRVQTHL